MNISKYEILLHIAEIGNLTKAAEQLGYSQSAISHVVSSLESELGVKLLHRDRNGAKVTKEAERLLPLMREICEKNRELYQKAAGINALEEGTIRLGTFLSFNINVLPQLMTSFSKRYPKIQFDVEQGGYREIEHWIVEGSIDCGFVRMPTRHDMVSTPLFQDRMMAIFPQSRELPWDKYPLNELEREEAIIYNEPAYDYDVQQVFKRIPPEKLVKVRANDYYSLIAMVEKGIGMGLIPELTTKRMPYQIARRELDPPMFRTVGIAYKQGQAISPAAHMFIEHVKNNIDIAVR